MRMIATVLGIALLCGGCSRHDPSDRSIMCPKPQIAGMEVRPEELQGWSRELGQGSRYQIIQVATAIRVAHPAANSTEVTDLIIASYCRKLEGGGDIGSDRAAVRDFATRARAAIDGEAPADAQ